MEIYSDSEMDLINRCISVASWNKRMERYCGKEGCNENVQQCLFIIRSVLKDLSFVINNQKEGNMSNRVVDPVKDVLALEEALINIDKKLEAHRQLVESIEFLDGLAEKLYPKIALLVNKKGIPPEEV